jgi:hypothetical protein
MTGSCDQNWFKECIMKANESKPIYFTFTTWKETCPPVHINNVQLSAWWRCQVSRATPWQETYWHKHIFLKRKQLGITITKMYWLLWFKSKLSTSKKLLIYRTILQPTWTCGIQLWGMASTSNIEILERFQSKALRMIWYVSNTVIWRNLPLQLSIQCSPNDLVELPDEQAIVKTPAK